MKQNLIDQAEFEVVAGNGGNGKVAFSHSWQRIKGGPGGGDGGNGGSVYLIADGNMATLKYFTGRDRFQAEAGGHGGINNRHGKNAEDLEIRVPVGTLITRVNGEQRIVDLDTPGQRECVARGGKGGRGNKALSNSRNTTPMEAEPGEKGEKFKIKLELKVLADIGLVGMPNVGKSSLLAVLTKARPEIGDYPFTTISPNLGVMGVGARLPRPLVVGGETPPLPGQIVIADIPGLIEDAHEGRGLGVAFLKHIERCRGLVYVLAMSSGQETVNSEQGLTELWSQYMTIKEELKEYSKEMLDKPSIVVVNKKDQISDKAQERLSDFFWKNNIDILFVSALTGEGVEKLREGIAELVGARRASPVHGEGI